MNKLKDQKAPRIWQYDLLKTYACFLVVWGHAIVNLTSSDCLDNPLYRFIYSFHMSLFMMISGFFSSSVKKLDLVSFIKKKFMQLLYPCFIWGMVLFILMYGYGFFCDGSSNFTFSQLLSDFYWYSDFWFLKSCFICFCFAFLGMKYCDKLWIWGPGTLLLSQFVIVFQVPFMYPSFFIGILLRRYNSLMISLIKYRYIIWSLFVLMSLLWTKEIWIGCHGFSLEIYDNPSKSLIFLFILRLYRMVIGVFGALSFIILFRMIDRPLDSLQIIRNICNYGQYTLEIYVIHSVLFVYVACRFLTLDGLSFFQYNFFVTPIISVIVIFLCNYIIHMLRKKDLLFYLFFGRTCK